MATQATPMNSTLVHPTVPNICRRPTSGTMAGPRILVFGCARSGTTLLLNLLRTYEQVVVREAEQCVTNLLEDPHPGWVASKRTAHCAEHLCADLPFLRQGVWILDIIRDPRDVITSVLEPFPGYYCGFERWDRDLRVSEVLAGRHLRYLRIRYEELVARPDDVQQNLADILALTPTVPFGTSSRSCRTPCPPPWYRRSAV
jgi:hypothetical protein